MRNNEFDEQYLLKSLITDVMHSDPMSDLHQRKISRARQVLEAADTCRSIVRSMGDKAMPFQNVARFHKHTTTSKFNFIGTRLFMWNFSCKIYRFVEDNRSEYTINPLRVSTKRSYSPTCVHCLQQNAKFKS